MKYFEVKNLCYSYYKKPLCLKDINFSLQKNQKILVLAKDDMGKSTLLKTASLFDDKSFGNIYFEEKNARKIDDEEKKFSLILESPALISGSIRKNIDFLCKQENIQNLTDASLDTFLKLFNIPFDSKVSVKRLSYEEKVKLSLLRSFIKNPNIVFVDDILKNAIDSEQFNIVQDLKMLLNNRTAVVTLSDISFNKQRDFLPEICFDKILYLNLAEGKEYKSVADFENDLPDLDSLDFFAQKEKQSAIIEKTNDEYFIIIGNSKFRFEKSSFDKLSQLNLENGESEDVVLYCSQNQDINSLSNERLCELVRQNKIYIYLKLDGTRVI